MTAFDPAEARLFLKNLVEKMGFMVSDVVIEELDDGSLRINVDCPEMEDHIRHKGDTLNAMQHLMRVFFATAGYETRNSQLDLNGYKKAEEERTREMAERIAASVEIIGEAQTLPPMSPYFRRIVHMTLKDSETVQTESVGEGRGRRVQISKR